MDLTFRNSRTTIENAIIDQLSLAYGERQPAAATIAALRVRPSIGLTTQDAHLVFVTAIGRVYRWRPYSLDADDGVLFVKPSDVATANPGRWTQTSSKEPNGYLRTCRLHNEDESSIDGILAHIEGNVPAMLVSWTDTQYQPRSLKRGALYWATYNFTLFVVSISMRGDQSSRQGSGIASEAAVDPGTEAMLGDAKASLAGSDIGLDGVAFTDFTAEEVMLKDLENRQFIESLKLYVKASVQNPDPPDTVFQIDELGGLQIQRQMLNEGAYDAKNILLSGYTVPVGTGLTKAPIAGTAVIGGANVSSTPAAHAFPANMLTYRDLLPDGTFRYQSVAASQPVPDVAPDAMRVGVTVTDGASVIWDELIGDEIHNVGDVDVVKSAGTGVVSIAIAPTSASLTVGGTQQLAAIATYVDGHTLDVSKIADWTVSAPSVTSIDYTGLLTALTAGSATVTCSYDGIASGNSVAVSVS